MKKISRLIAVVILLAGFASVAKAEFRWGATAGVNITSLDFKQDLFKVTDGVGPVLGVQGEMMLPGIGFGFDVGAMYSMQGGGMNLGQWPIWEADGYGKEHSYLHTLSIPLDVRFKWTRMNGFEDYLAPFVFGGPIFNFTVAHNKMRAMDYAGGSIGIQAGLGVELFKRWQLQGSYVWGMTYVMKAAKLQDYSARERYWTVRAVYFF